MINYKGIKEALKSCNEKYNTPEKAKYYLVHILKTNNCDGSLRVGYGGKYDQDKKATKQKKAKCNCQRP